MVCADVVVETGEVLVLVALAGLVAAAGVTAAAGAVTAAAGAGELEAVEVADVESPPPQADNTALPSTIENVKEIELLRIRLLAAFLIAFGPGGVMAVSVSQAEQ